MQTVELKLNFGKVCLVDASDIELLSQYNWNAYKGRTTWYAAAIGINCVPLAMHRFLFGFPAGLNVDHANGNGLDNRRSNLRVATNSQNQQNSRKKSNCLSEFKGVHLCRDKHRSKPWRGAIFVPPGRRLSLGYFETEIEAAKAYDKAAVEHFGEFASLNFKN